MSIIAAIIFLFPFYIVIVNAFKTNQGIFENALAWPSARSFTFENFINVFYEMDYLRSFFNSFLVTLSANVVIILFSSMLAWKLVRVKSTISIIIFYILIASLLIPFQSIMLPLVKTMGQLHLLNLFGLIFMYLGFQISFSVFLYHGFIKNIPYEIEESAQLEGSYSMRTFFYIIFPILKPIHITIIILNTMWIWNDFLLPQLTINQPHSRTLPLQIFYFFAGRAKDWPLGLAALLLTLLPAIIFYFITQKYIVRNMAQGAIK